MKCALIAAAALLILLVAGPALALTQDEAQHVVNASGCPAEAHVLTWAWTDDWNAFYAYNMFDGGGTIGLINFHLVPDERWKRFVLHHEIGHCLQGRGEWEADAYAIRQMAKEGLDGSDIQAQIWAWDYGRNGYLGDADSPHGLLTHRIVRGWLNRVIALVEAP